MKDKTLRLCLFSACGFLLLFHLQLFWALRDEALRGYSDFAAFYAAGKLVHLGPASGLYDYDQQARIQAALFPQVQIRQAPLLYYHPPFEVLLFLPLSFLSYSTAYLLWAFLNLCILLALPWLLRPCVGRLEVTVRPFFPIFFLLFFPAFVALIQGQDSVLLLLIFALALRSFGLGNQFKAGCLLALGLFKFQLVLPFLVPFVLRCRWKLITGWAFVAAVLALVSMQIVGARGVVQYLGFLWDLNQHLASRGNQEARAIYPGSMPNLRGVVYSLAAGKIPESYLLLAIAVGSAFLLLWAATRWPWNRREDANAFDLLFALSLTVALLVSYHLQVHDLSLLSLPIIIVLNDAISEDTSPRRLRVALMAASCAFLVSPVYLLLLRWGRLYLLFWPILLFAIGIAHRVAAAPRSDG